MKKSALVLVILFSLLFILGAGVGGFFVGKYFIEKRSESEESEEDDGEENIPEDEKESLHSSKGNAQGPYYHSIYSAISVDGLNWEKLNEKHFDHASVPGAVVRNGVIYLYFVDASGDEDQLSVGISDDFAETFTKHKVEFRNMHSYDAVDPHPELIGGGIRLYYLGDFYTGHEGGKEEKFTIYYSESEDGISFGESNSVYESNEVTTDPDVFKTDSDWRMLVSQGGGLTLLTSDDGETEFGEVSGFSWNEGGVCDTIEIGGIYYTHYCDRGISRSTGADTGLLTEDTVVLDDKDEVGKIICDPSVIQLADELYLMFYKVQEINDGGQ